MRIVSLLPSATEIICDLGLGSQLVGVSHECDYPAHVQRLPKVTSSVIPKDAPSAEIDRLVRERLRSHESLYQLDMELVERLRPNLIVSQSLCNVCAVSAADVEKAVCSLPTSPGVVNLEPTTLQDMFDTLMEVGRAAGILSRAERRVSELEARVAAVAEHCGTRDPISVLFLEWIDPPFSAGHWNPELITIAGGIDCFGVPGEPSRTLSWNEISNARPEIALIACCGYSISRTMEDLQTLARDPVWSALPCVRNRNVHVFDGNAYFSRPGPRLVDGLEMLAGTLRPHRFIKEAVHSGNSDSQQFTREFLGFGTAAPILGRQSS